MRTSNSESTSIVCSWSLYDICPHPTTTIYEPPPEKSKLYSGVGKNEIWCCASRLFRFYSPELRTGKDYISRPVIWFSSSFWELREGRIPFLYLFRTVLKWPSKVTMRLRLLLPLISLSLAPVFKPMRGKIKTNCTLYARFFPRFHQVTGNC